MAKQNCWEFKKCGREPSGTKVAELGVCKAAVEYRVNGVHNGIDGGRACWVVAGILCGGKVQGSFALKMANCKECDFYKLVATDEGKKFILSGDLLSRI